MIDVAKRSLTVNCVDVAYLEQGSGPLVLLCHGWPELSYSWRRQIPVLAAAGYRVVAPDMRGYGDSSAPEAIDAYSIFDLVGDMVALVGALGEGQAIVVGHDWGANVAWHCALFRPDLFKAVAALSVPFARRSPAPPLEVLRRKNFETFYWLYFQPAGQAEAEFERDVTRTMRAAFYGRGVSLVMNPGKGFLDEARIPDAPPAWLSEENVAHYAEIFRRTGFRGGLNWYRNIDRNWALTAPWQDARIAPPSLFIAGSRDAVIKGPLGEARLNDMDRLLADFRGKLIIEGAGHWIQQERAEEVNAALLGFLKGL
jgi:pimeloyl-ACP methyl ester carboxylesterase